MRRFITFGLVALLGLTIFGGTLTSAEMDSKDGERAKIELTDEQKQELDALYKDLLEARKAILDKYVEYGVLSKGEAEKKLAWLEEHYTKVKEHGYLPPMHHKWDKDKHKKKDNN
ncbi:YckD family protein [Fredinandcohnia humi]